VPHAVRLGACQSLAQLAFPEEIVPDIRERIWSTGVIHHILRYARNGELTVHRKAIINQVTFDHQIASGTSS